MMNRQALAICLALLTLSVGATGTHAAAIPVPNGDFENWTVIGDGGITNTGWASVPGGQTPASNVGQNDEMWTNPSSFASGWQSNGPAGTSGPYGLQHPSAGQHERSTVPGPLTGPHFSGNFIGFVNAPATGDQAGLQSVQSGVLGTLQQGVYVLTAAVGARPVGNWNDLSYSISLVADPVLGAPDNGGLALGSRDGTILGTPASVTLVPAAAALGSNQQDLVYMLTLGPGDPNIGREFAIRIDVENLLMEGGVENLTQFTQGNFDNVRLELVPEPSSIALAVLGGAFALATVARRRRYA